ncbi:MBL fold metallo-hydrolase [Catenisphaera adipataccumulans]|jgi:phosphoribosyl 1,2-cyclic phosphodiesterase|uniref:Phosphoribosyl 1,2-cyclic phosphodiesterase n=1 Tax=Catenisphaera adipataccumulans TaxID=700500 RepID=A0A7W8CY40_9FIRM|nr:MBL fold metallo-hydrolase [Catenisphaera adipataccumulans]MBB5182402.1 phosphoribosyl 1,2-cyclic phosphodiesterase [Catenisphaera adipataccumulans]
MRIDLLCSGSKGNCAVVREGNTQLMIDCGSTKKYLTQAMTKANVQLEDTDAVLITHTHTDHIKQLKMVRHLPVYSYCDLDDVDVHHVVQPLSEFDIGLFHIRVIGLSHDAPKTCGYVIESPTDKLVYITDTGYVPNDEKTYLTDAGHYIFESNHDIAKLMQTRRPMFVKQRILSDNGHLNNEDAGHYLTELINDRTKDIVLAHLSQEANHPQLALQAVKDQFARRDLPMNSFHLQAAEQFEITTIGE